VRADPDGCKHEIESGPRVGQRCGLGELEYCARHDPHRRWLRARDRAAQLELEAAQARIKQAWIAYEVFAHHGACASCQEGRRAEGLKALERLESTKDVAYKARREREEYDGKRNG
jgi:hypothetical protein